MKSKLSIIVITVIILLAIPFQSIQAQSGDETTEKYLLILPVQQPEFDRIPAGLDELKAQNYAVSLLHSQANPLLQKLDKMVAEGKITGYNIRPDVHGIVVQGVSENMGTSLQSLAEKATVMPFEKTTPTCAIEGANALTTQIVAMSRLRYIAEQGLDPLASSTTDPSIEAFRNWVQGKTKPNVDVHLRILHGSKVIATAQTTSDSDGDYLFWPDWHFCPSSGYSWTLRPGDIVEVTAHNNTVRTKVTYLLAWANPETNRVEGYSQAGHRMEVTALQPKENGCDATKYTKEKTVAPNGAFAIDFNGLADFNRRAVFALLAKDSAGNGTATFIGAFQVIIDSDVFYVRLKPYTRLTATIYRNGHQLTVFHGVTSKTGIFYQRFDDFRPGDDLQISGGGVTMRYHVIPLTAELDVIHNKVTGAASPRRLIRADTYSRASHWNRVMTSCSWDGACNVQKADGNGRFAISMDMDITRGDYGYVDAFDSEGNYQSQSVGATAIVANLSYSSVSGYWKDPSAQSVDVILKGPDGRVKETQTNQWLDSWDGGFDVWFSHKIEPHDIVVVKSTDGTESESMTVQTLSARLDTNSGKLVGESSHGKLVAWLDDFRRASGTSGFCATKNGSDHYDLTFAGAQIGAQDHGALWLSGNDGHYTERVFNAFSVNTEEKDRYVLGFTKTPETSVTVSLRRNGNTVETKHIVSNSDGYFQISFDHGVIQANDVLQVNAQDGDAVTLSLPLLTVEKDAQHNQLVGQAPANQPIHPRLYRVAVGWRYANSRIGATDASGHYAVSFDGLFSWGDCAKIQVNQPCIQPGVRYYTPKGHSITLDGALPDPVSADAFEPDNDAAHASHFTTIQSHTFDVHNDVDWVVFNVSAQDVGKVFRIETFNLGWDGDTHLYLYDTNGTTLLEEDDNSGVGYASKILWTPTRPGAYYVKVAPYSENYTTYCGASYDLIITATRAVMYLPLALQSYR